MASKLFDLTGRRALITGSSQGIGLALARGLASAGAEVVLNGRDAAKLATAQQKLAAEGYRATTAAFDVTNASAVREAIDRIEAEQGPIEILCNNAGINLRGPMQDIAEETWRAVMATNLDSAFFCAQAVARHMLKRGRGKIINTCSVMSMLARPTIAPYSATKGALMMLTKAMCADWAPHGIQANGIAPGYFATEMTAPLMANKDWNDWLCRRTPAGRWGQVEELEGAVIFLASAASSYVNGQLLYVDGGMTSVV